ncbi:hypothetical protein [Pseudanabaena yagii]|uniref:Uncharacterized protein n=1 Tax=Pseudanabaena yagii GIHE-NHR1 TaxID=2722753 RepID=A0ABX1LVR1_9CYAN|nr:hypothetical protein [Pseudanabaena yagii]NMF59100.1 hypothetical protein [Pseudanabaena yagii GIHE-NHR1]
MNFLLLAQQGNHEGIAPTDWYYFWRSLTSDRAHQVPHEVLSPTPSQTHPNLPALTSLLNIHS